MSNDEARTTCPLRATADVPVWTEGLLDVNVSFLQELGSIADRGRALLPRPLFGAGAKADVEELSRVREVGDLTTTGPGNGDSEESEPRGRCAGVCRLSFP